MMATDVAKVLQRIEGLPVPRHLFVLPGWVAGGALDRLVDEGYLTCAYSQRDKNGALQVAMSLNLTQKAERLLRPPRATWRDKILKASAAGVCLIALNLVILYLA
jgi:hypothetical protein